MKVSGFLKSTLTAVACTGIVLPQAAVLAAPPELEKSQTDAVKVPKPTDVSLDKRGVLTGTIVDKNGKAAVEADVLVKQGRRLVAKTKTDKKGNFEVSKLRGGVYQILVGDTAAFVRVWADGTAPPKAHDTALIVADGKLVLGQGVIPPADILSGLVLGGTVASITIGAINMSNIDDIEDRVNQNNAAINAVQNSLN